MAKKEFSLGETLAEVLGKVPEAGAEERIVMLPLEDITPDERNFYSTEGIEALAANIELVGLLDPLRVRADPDAPGHYLIVSGHRRRLALWSLHETDPKRWERVPCVVETVETSPEMQELRLIYANADTRRMSPADQARQAERVEELLYALKEQGVEFPGRMRDHVAEACRLGQSKLAELKVIQDKLTNPEIRWYWDNGKLNQAQAYAIAKAKPYTQAALCTFIGADKLPERASWNIESNIKKIEAIAERKCKHTGTYCENCEAMLDRTFRNTNSYSACEWHCCAECPEMTRCKAVCEREAANAEKKKAQEKEKRSAERAVEKSREAAAIGVTRKIWDRFGELRKAKGLSAKDLCEARGESYFASWHGQDWLESMEAPEAKFTEHTSVPWGNLQADDVKKLCRTAEALGCSTDYLLGATDEKRPWRDTPWISCEDRDPPEGSFVFACTRDGVVVPSVYFRARFMDFTERSVGNNMIQRVQYWMPLPKMPDGKKWQGQETLEGMIGK